jgi:hypothetical protein
MDKTITMPYKRTAKPTIIKNLSKDMSLFKKRDLRMKRYVLEVLDKISSIENKEERWKLFDKLIREANYDRDD